jgi:transposase
MIYPSNLTDEEWMVMEPLIPPARRGGRRRSTDRRGAMSGIMDVLTSGCQWRSIASDPPPRATVVHYFSLWRWHIGSKASCMLYVLCRDDKSREPEPAACVIDSKSVRAAENSDAIIDRYGFYTDKSIKRKKRHMLTNSTGLRLAALVHSAGIQDRGGGLLLVATPIGMLPLLQTLFADSGDAGPIFRARVKKLLPQLNIEIIRRSDAATDFEALPRRWIVERTIAWLNRCRRLVKHLDNLTVTPRLFSKLAFIRLILRKPCNA